MKGNASGGTGVGVNATGATGVAAIGTATGVSAAASGSAGVAVAATSISSTTAIKATNTGTGTAVHAINTGPGTCVQAESTNGRGGSFAGKPAQIQLVPGTGATHPTAGKAGDLYVDKATRAVVLQGRRRQGHLGHDRLTRPPARAADPGRAGRR